MATADDFEIEDTFNCQGKQCNVKVHHVGIEWTCKGSSRSVHFKMSSHLKANPSGHTRSNCVHRSRSQTLISDINRQK